MLTVTLHDDVVRLAFSSARSRLLRYGVSAYVTRGALVDTGFPGIRRELLAWLATHPVDGALITHAHEDHAGNAEALARQGLPLQMAPETESQLRDFGSVGFYRRFCWGTPTDLRSPVTRFVHPALELLAARGHSADHHVVWDAERETVFGGDLFIGVKVRIAHQHEDIRAQVIAVRSIAEMRPRRFFDAHRGPLENPVPQLRAKADWMEETIGEIEDRLRRGWPARAIRDDVLGREDFTGVASNGDYSRLAFVRSVIDSTRRVPRE